MRMKREWDSIVITKIALAVYVAPNSKKHIHKDRPLHGLVLNDEESVKEYCFSDGRVMRTEGGTLFYLPRGSSYYVRTIRQGGCYAINFDADIDDEPFSVELRNRDALQKNFKTACAEWKSNAPSAPSAAMRALYDGIYRMRKEKEREYIPSERQERILPAVERMERAFADCDVTVASLSELCGMSEVYFRKIFLHKFGRSPKEYLIEKRMEYAKQLLSSGQFDVSDVAELCGYAEPCHFSREFKKRVGVSPKEYRE